MVVSIDKRYSLYSTRLRNKHNMNSTKLDPDLNNSYIVDLDQHQIVRIRFEDLFDCELKINHTNSPKFLGFSFCHVFRYYEHVGQHAPNFRHPAQTCHLQNMIFCTWEIILQQLLMNCQILKLLLFLNRDIFFLKHEYSIYNVRKP